MGLKFSMSSGDAWFRDYHTQRYRGESNVTLAFSTKE
jgi:hypothetical protein